MNNFLYLQGNHKSQGVLTGKLPKAVFTCQNSVGLPWDERYKQYVAMSGLDCVNMISRIPLVADDALISALVERWRQETHTFHMPVGELTITLEDVAVLFGLPVDGEAVCQRTDCDWPAVVMDLLGHVDETTFRPGGSPKRINVSWLHKNFWCCPAGADENTVQQYARAYLLMLVGTILFPAHPGHSISAIYLPLFEDFQKAGRYSWGSAVLAFLYRELCCATKSKRGLIGGASMLLQMWSWMRFPFGRPNCPAGSFMPLNLRGEDGNERAPLGCFLSGYHAFEHMSTTARLKVYRQAIDNLKDREVDWQPYEGKKNLLPPICTTTPELWTTTAPLIHFWIVEIYNPHRVMRQFSRYQTIPPFHRNTDIELDGIMNGVGNNWPILHAAYLRNWGHRWGSCLLDERKYDPSERDAYMQWFSHVSIMYLDRYPTPEAPILKKVNNKLYFFVFSYSSMNLIHTFRYSIQNL
jgi:Plant mobile domain